MVLSLQWQIPTFKINETAGALEITELTGVHEMRVEGVSCGKSVLNVALSVWARKFQILATVFYMLGKFVIAVMRYGINIIVLLCQAIYHF